MNALPYISSSVFSLLSKWLLVAWWKTLHSGLLQRNCWSIHSSSMLGQMIILQERSWRGFLISVTALRSWRLTFWFLMSENCKHLVICNLHLHIFLPITEERGRYACTKENTRWSEGGDVSGRNFMSAINESKFYLLMDFFLKACRVYKYFW